MRLTFKPYLYENIFIKIPKGITESPWSIISTQTLKVVEK